jgi:uncharacterized protein YdiU (UPF0061 family)
MTNPIEGMTAQTETIAPIAFDNTYARLPDRFFERLKPTPVAAPRLVRLNEKLALHLGLDPKQLATRKGLRCSRASPAGERRAHCHGLCRHHPAPASAGDGRAILLGEASTATASADIQLKGSGPTLPAGRRTRRVGPVLREYRQRRWPRSAS